MLKRFVVVLAGLGFLSACGGGSGLGKLADETAEKVCACKDMECANKAMGEYGTKAAELAKDAKPEDAEKVGAAMTKAQKCMTDMAAKAAGGAGEGK